MALVVVASAKGAPGVTTLTVALAALTEGAIAADLDPDGGDLALRYGREDGAPLDPEVGLLSLAASLRRDHTEIVNQTGSVEEHLQVTDGGLDVLLGVTGPEQAVGLGPLWSPLARALAGTDRMVFADCGRLGPASPAMPVLMQADAVLLLARAELEEIAHLRERLRFLTATLPGRYAGPARIGVVLVSRERDRAAAPRTEQLLRASGLAVPVLGTIADDPRGADRLRGLHGGRPGRTTLVRSIRSLLPDVLALTGHALTVGVLTDTALTINGHAAPVPEPTPDPPPAPASPRMAADPLPTPQPPVGPGPENDVWLGTRAAERAPGYRSPYQHAPPDIDPAQPAPSEPAVPEEQVIPAEQAAFNEPVEEPIDEPAEAEADPPPAAAEQQSENGWPRPGRGTGTLSGVTATVLQNWGR
jgi:MinD-like ATPase involved in chromosome partitioning or flagellar assembly